MVAVCMNLDMIRRDMRPYKEKFVSGNQYIRTFSNNVKTDELEWHLDKEDRIVEVVSNKGKWMVQLDNKLPVLLNKKVFIPKETYHRVIKGKGQLVVKITKL